MWHLKHTARIFHDESGNVIKKDSGYFLLNMDHNSPNSVKSYVKEIANSTYTENLCDKYLLCGLPLSHSRMIQIA